MKRGAELPERNDELTETEARRRVRNAWRSLLAISLFLIVPSAGLLFIAIKTDKGMADVFGYFFVIGILLALALMVRKGSRVALGLSILLYAANAASELSDLMSGVQPKGLVFDLIVLAYLAKAWPAAASLRRLRPTTNKSDGSSARPSGGAPTPAS